MKNVEMVKPNIHTVANVYLLYTRNRLWASATLLSSVSIWVIRLLNSSDAQVRKYIKLHSCATPAKKNRVIINLVGSIQTSEFLVPSLVI